jgi:hypothetical protein
MNGYRRTSEKMNLSLSHHRLVPILFLIFVLISHGLLLLNNGVYWDGWLFYGHYLNHDSESLHRLFAEHGDPWVAYFHQVFWVMPNIIFAYKLVSFICILLSTIFVHALAQRTQFFKKSESFFIAAIFCTYTGYQVHVEISVIFYWFCYTIFLFAANLALDSFARTKPISISFRILALLLFFYSFQTASLLVFYFTFLVLLIIYRWQAKPNDQKRGAAAAIAFGHIDFFSLPFIYWSLKKLLWMPYGLYAGYNQFQLDIHQWKVNVALYYHNAIRMQFHYARETLTNHPVFFVLVAVLILVSKLLLNNRLNNGEKIEYGQTAICRSKSVKNAIYLGVYALFMLICACFPYVVVGKVPSPTGFDTRHALLVSLPIALGLVAIGRMISIVFQIKWVSMTLKILAYLLVVAFMVTTWKIYLDWQVRWIKDASIITNLRILPKDKVNRVNFIYVDDEDLPLTTRYAMYEYAGIFKMAWGTERRFGCNCYDHRNLVEVVKNLPLKMYLLKDFDINQMSYCLAVLHINFPELNRDELLLVAKYYWYRWMRPAELDDFLKGLTSLHLSDFDCFSRNELETKMIEPGFSPCALSIVKNIDALSEKK